MRRTFAAAVAGALTASGLAAVPLLATSEGALAQNAAERPAAAQAPKIVWGECSTGELLAIRAECGLLEVPVNYAKPTGRKIKIAVSRVKASDPRRQGVILANPGGPGGAGLGLAAYRDIVPNGAGKAYDWIGFDPRGVGESRPAISCNADYAKGPRPDYTPQAKGTKLSKAETAWLARSKAYAASCAKKYGYLLPYMRTVDTVRDMDQIRQALGEKKINYYGFSYGTYLGQTYATMYPGRVRRMVLDGNVDSRGVWYSAQLRQDEAFEKVIAKFFAWVAKYPKVYKLGSSEAEVRKRYYAQLAKLRKTPNGPLGPSEWTDAFVRAGYAESLWPQTASAFADVANHNQTTLMNLLYEEAGTPGDDNSFAVYNAVQCADAKWPKSYTKGWRDDSFATAAKAPFMTWSNVWFNTPCIYWPTPAGTPLKIDGSKLAALKTKILLVNTMGDAATPYAGALAVRKLFPTASLIAERGTTTHANTLNGNMCVDNAVATYLATGKLPARKAGNVADKTCGPSELPTPGPAELAYAEKEGVGEAVSRTQEGHGATAPAAPAPAPAAPAPAPAAPAPGPVDRQSGQRKAGKASAYPTRDDSVLRGVIGLLQ